MYIFDSLVHETIWGGDALKKYKNAQGKIGHLYLVNGHKNLSTPILNGEFKNQFLSDVFPIKKTEWLMQEYDEFPLTIALVDAHNDLSIQVHPDNECAKMLENKEIGKTESWIFLKEPNLGWIYGGCTKSSIKDVQNALDTNKINDVTAHFDVKKLDCVTIHAGTLHSMTSGSVVYEIEYGSDFTYRFYDFERTDEKGNKRELHTEKALKAIKPTLKPVKENVQNDKWIFTDVYEICYKTNISFYINKSNKVEILTVLQGNGFCDGVQVQSGMSILLLPFEKIENVNFLETIIARLK